MTRTQAEPKGYLSATQTPDGVIHVCSSRLYYAFNLVWIDPYFAPIGRGDLDEDGVVEADDLRILVEQWLEGCLVDQWCGGRDINRDGIVNFLDFAILGSEWHTSRP